MESRVLVVVEMAALQFTAHLFLASSISGSAIVEDKVEVTYFLKIYATVSIDSVLQIVDPDDLTVEHYTLPPEYSYQSWPDWNTWEASPDIVKGFPCYRSGYDYDGRVG